MWKKSDMSYSQPEPIVPAQNPVEQLRERALIGSSIVVKGEISGEEDLTIQGQVEGKVELKRHNITVGKNGRLKADVFGKIISVEGEVHGNVYGEEKIVVRSSGVVQGNMVAPRVSLEDGSRFKGNIDMEIKRVEKQPTLAPLTSEPKFEGDHTKKGGPDSSRKEASELKKPDLGFKSDPNASKT